MSRPLPATYNSCADVSSVADDLDILVSVSANLLHIQSNAKVSKICIELTTAPGLGEAVLAHLIPDILDGR